jgi:D-cysteine desulfhydrase
MEPVSLRFPPRVELANLPTRVQSLDRLSSELGGPRLFVKRDDETGSDLSGNKVRKLEFLLAEAEREHADLILTCGGIQSNHCRATALAARRRGMDSILFLRGEDPPDRDGNLFLDSLIGADIRFVTPETYADRQRVMSEEAQRQKAGGRRPYIIPEGGSNALGSLGYVAMLVELMDQASEDRGVHRSRFPWDHIVCATGSGGTVAGLLLGARLLGLETKIWGINVCDDARYFEDRVLDIAAQFEARWRPELLPSGTPAPAPLDRGSIQILEGYKGPAYARTYPEEIDLIREVARRDGLLLDPVYTGKAFHGMLVEARRGRFGRDTNVLFVHTGGIFSLFAYRAELLASDRIPSSPEQ